MYDHGKKYYLQIATRVHRFCQTLSLPGIGHDYIINQATGNCIAENLYCGSSVLYFLWHQNRKITTGRLLEDGIRIWRVDQVVPPCKRTVTSAKNVHVFASCTLQASKIALNLMMFMAPVQISTIAMHMFLSVVAVALIKCLSSKLE